MSELSGHHVGDLNTVTTTTVSWPLPGAWGPLIYPDFRLDSLEDHEY